MWQILTETGYLDEVLAMPAGRQRLANVEMLLKKAQDYERSVITDFFILSATLRDCRNTAWILGEADISGQSKEAVRIMSTHHSKGLEFPIVFAAGLGKSFNRQESRDKAVLHSRYGIGLDYVDLEQRMRVPRF